MAKVRDLATPSGESRNCTSVHLHLLTPTARCSPYTDKNIQIFSALLLIKRIALLGTVRVRKTT